MILHFIDYSSKWKNKYILYKIAETQIKKKIN